MTTLADEYEAAAELCAKKGFSSLADLFGLVSEECMGEILDNFGAFSRRVNDYAYAIAMNKLNLPEE